MTGGSVSKNAGILSRANELERIRARLIGVQEQLKTANEAKAAAEREVKAAVYEMDVAKAQKQALENTALKLEGECGQYTVALEGLRRSAAAAEKEKRRITLRMEENHADRDAALARIAALEGEYRALQAQEEGKASGEAALREKQSAVATAMEALKLELAALEAEESTVTQTVSELCALRSSLTEDRTRRQSLLEDCARQVQLLTAQIAQTEAALAARREEKTRLETEMHRVSDNRLQLESLRTQADRAARGKNDELLNMERDCARLEQRKTAAELEEKQLLDKLWDNYELSHSEAEKQRRELESVAKATRRIGELKRSIAALGAVNVGAIEEYRRVNERYTYLTDQREDVEKSKAELERIIDSITGRMKDIFARQFALISDSFTATFRELFGGGTASLELENKEDILNCGIEIRVQPPGKSLKIISLLSGGEKAFVAIALYFSILKVRPTPFVVLDEIEAALDDNNVTRFADYMRSMTDRTQFIVITHRRGTMEAADVLYGVTMQEQGITRMLTINLNDVERELHIR